MNNSFLVRKCRFHIEDDNIIGFFGVFKKGEKKEEHFFASLDNKKVKCQVQEWEYREDRFASGGETTVCKEYCVWIKLPNGWEEKEKLHLVQYNEREKRRIKVVSVKMLLKMRDEIPFNIDFVGMEKGKFLVNGWYLCNQEAKMVFEASGKKLDYQVMAVLRSDVKKVLPEGRGKGIHGFSASFEGVMPKQIKLTISANDKRTSFVIDTNKYSVRRILSKVQEIAERTNVYYFQNGAISTVKKMIGEMNKKNLPVDVDYSEWFKKHYPSSDILRNQREARLCYMPKISIVVPLYRTPEKYLKEMIQSVLDQSYENWELCLSDGSGKDSPVRLTLKEYEKSDKRIRVVYNEEPLQISQNTNKALEIASGDYIAFADHDDLLMPNALFECVTAINDNRNAELIYTDEDKVSMDGKEHFDPHFKSDYNPDMLLGVNYICHLCVVKRSLLEKAEGLNPEFDGAQDYDFVLRATECVERSENIIHVPKILYHWRAHKDSTAENPESKVYAYDAGKRAIETCLKRRGIDGEVFKTEYTGFYRVKRAVKDQPLVSVIIPTKDHIDDLKKCLKSLEEVNQYRNMEYIIVENNSEMEETFQYYEELQKEMPKAKVVRWEEKGFNYPAINNFGVSHSKGEYVLFLNNDTEVVNADCIEEMLSQCQRPEVGAVGARLYYEDGTIQHAGVVVGICGVAGHGFVGLPKDNPGYMGRIILIQNYSAVTAACLMMRKEVFDEVGQFDERYAVAFNDIDLCMRVRKAGYLIVYNPYAELNHYESKSRGYEDTDEKIQRFSTEIERFRLEWGEELTKGDPYYNPNLTLSKLDFSLNCEG